MLNKQISAFDPPPHTPKTAFYTVCKCLGCSWLLFAANRVILSGTERTSVRAENEKGRLLGVQPLCPGLRSLSSTGSSSYSTVDVLKKKKQPKPPKLYSVTKTLLIHSKQHMPKEK